MDKRQVIVIADIHDSFPDLSKNHKQEWESQASIDFLMNTISSIGYDPILIEPIKSKLHIIDTIKGILDKSNVLNPILFNLVEGFRSRNREAYVPALAEFFGIAFTGSDAYAQNISMDKYLTKLIVKDLRIPVKDSYLLKDIKDLPSILYYPLFLKPNAEGSSMGISQANIIYTRTELESKAMKLLEEFESILLEEYLEGDDLTLGVFGNYPNYNATSVAKLHYASDVYCEDTKSKNSMSESLSFTMEKKLETKIQKDSLEICKRLQTTGYARLDWKCDAKGNPFFLEINLTPGLSRYYSSLPICFEANFGNYTDLIKKVLQTGYDNYNTNRIFEYGKLQKI